MKREGGMSGIGDLLLLSPTLTGSLGSADPPQNCFRHQPQGRTLDSAPYASPEALAILGEQHGGGREPCRGRGRGLPPVWA